MFEDVLYMPVTIRLMRFGKRGYATYRIVALDKRKKRDGSYIEKVGTYNPHAETPFVIDSEKLNAWLKKGAVLSEGMQKLMKKISEVIKKA